MCCVGSSVAVSQTIVGAPLFTLQAVRYALAAVLLGVLARLTGRRLPRPRGRDWAWLGGVAATGLVLFNVGVVHGEHLAVVVTALAFLLWYTAVSRIGADRAGLFTGMAPVAAAAGGVLLGDPVPGPAVWAGLALVAAGLALGLRSRRPRPTRSRVCHGWFARHRGATRANLGARSC